MEENAHLLSTYVTVGVLDVHVWSLLAEWNVVENSSCSVCMSKVLFRERQIKACQAAKTKVMPFYVAQQGMVL